jgi:hypothetical protein
VIIVRGVNLDTGVRQDETVVADLSEARKLIHKLRTLRARHDAVVHGIVRQAEIESP